MDYPLSRRPRRLRTTPALRELTAETHLRPADFILPMFIADGLEEPNAISAMPGVYQHTFDSLTRAAEQTLEQGVRCVDLFGVPLAEDKDENGSQAWAENGILNRAIAHLRKEFGDDLLIMADTCLDEFTSHVDMAVSQASAGAHLVSPSGMMDGQVAAIREGLDAAGFKDVAIMAYSAKYASAFFGPFREAVGSSLQGDRRTYQQDPANRRESLLEAQLDIDEGADFVMVKPALAYLDIISEIAEFSPVPVSAYQVSGEYSMIQAAGLNGWVDRDAAMMESLLSIKRAGANQILTYFATDAARMLNQQ